MNYYFVLEIDQNQSLEPLEGLKEKIDQVSLAWGNSGCRFPCPLNAQSCEAKLVKGGSSGSGISTGLCVRRPQANPTVPPPQAWQGERGSP